MELFNSSLYAGTESVTPYDTWLSCATEKVLFEHWLTEHLPRFNFSRIKDRPVTVLDLGCGWGATSLRLLRVLTGMGLTVDFVGVDPYQAQLNRFDQQIPKNFRGDIELICSDISKFDPNQTFDFVLASHVLYYTNDLLDSLRKLCLLGRELVIVHHGNNGINTIHRKFRDYVHSGPHVISTDEDILSALDSIDLPGRLVQHYQFPSTVNVSCYQGTNTADSKNLTAFFLERAHSELSEESYSEVARFVNAEYPHDHLMIHDVGIITVR
ncbi:MAG: class I SAM-dependent methyltransferase [Parcubacteria group bacterium]|nr:class I SAM-dependent methyltransferase [Parcubacteria group bacterium]